MFINLIIGSIAAYTFSRLQFKGKVATFNFFLGSRLIPVIAVAIPYYVIIQTMGLLDTHISSSWCIWHLLFRSRFGF